MTADVIHNWLFRQQGYSYRPVPGTVEVCEDPQVADTFAVRFKDAADEGRTVDLLFICSDGEGTVDEVLDAVLEEVEFTTWPPTSGALRFFV